MGKEYIWPDGRSYKDEYYMNKKEGYGVFCWPDNFEYLEFWKNKNQHGQGTYIINDKI